LARKARRLSSGDNFLEERLLLGFGEEGDVVDDAKREETALPLFIPLHKPALFFKGTKLLRG